MTNSEKGVYYNDLTVHKLDGRLTVRLPRLQGQNAIQEEFYSVNGKNYLIKRGETVEIPEEVAEVIRNAEMAEEYAMNYAEASVKKINEQALK